MHSPTVLSTAMHYILLDRIRYRLISSHVGADISTSWFNQPLHKQQQDAKCFSYVSSVDLLIVLPSRALSRLSLSVGQLLLLPYARMPM